MNTYFCNLYYNKNFTKQKHFNILNYYHAEFVKLFKSGLPAYFDAVNKKDAGKRVVEKNKGILRNFIFYNSKVVKFIIVDIDNKNTFENKFELLEYLKDFNLIPSWVLDTNKGYHVGYILKNAIPYENKTSIKFARDTLKKLSLFLGGDPNALRLSGRFRNPLMHDTFYTNFTYDLIDIIDNIPETILENIKIEHNKNKKFHKNIYSLKQLILEVMNDITKIKNVKPGFRNSFLWYTGMIIAKNFQHLSLNEKLVEFEKIKEKIYFYNNNMEFPLENEEVETIIKSIKKYYLKGKIMVGLGGYNSWTKEMKNLYMKKYLKEKGIIKHSNEERKEINKNKVLQAVYRLRGKGEKLSVRKIANECKLGKTTVAKYVNELKKDSKFAVLFDK